MNVNRLSPLTGEEPQWNPHKWSANSKFNNCYAYAMDDHEESSDQRGKKPIPGPDLSRYTCSRIIEGLKNEIPQMYPATFETPCQPGFKKIYAAVSEESVNNDFHFWRQDYDGLWSHKPGSRNPTRVDGNNKPIENPENANRNSDTYNYTQSCGFFCIPSGSRDKPS